MTINYAFFAFKRSISDAKEMNPALSQIRARFANPDYRVINIETVEPETLLGFRLSAGGLRVWYEKIDASSAPLGAQEGDSEAILANAQVNILENEELRKPR